MSNYIAQAQQFLTDTKTALNVQFLYNGKHFDEDKENRDIYEITLSNERGKMTFKFGNALNDIEHWTVPGVYSTNGGKPTDNKSHAYTQTLHRFTDKIEATKWAININHRPNITHVKRVEPSCYDVLTCLTHYEPGTFDDFCSSYGYDNDSIKGLNTYNAVVKEWRDLCRIFYPSQLELLAEIN